MNGKTKRLFSLLLCLVLLCGLQPGAVLADDPEPHEHTWGDWETTTPATCTEPGAEKRTCTCGATETQSVPALGHGFGGDGICLICHYDALAAVDSDIRTEHCEAAGKDRDYKHLFVYSYEKSKQPCKEAGYDAYVCYFCGKEVHVPVPATWNCLPGGELHTVKEATCTADGKVYWNCVSCGEPCDYVTIPKLGHDYIKTQYQAATATTDGYVKYKCTRCGETKTETIPKLGSTYQVPDVGRIIEDYIKEVTDGYAKNCLKYTDYYAPRDSVVTVNANSAGWVKITIGGPGMLTDKTTNRDFMVVWAQEDSGNKFCEVLIDTETPTQDPNFPEGTLSARYKDRKMDVYLVGFGTEGRVGLRSIAIHGNYINVYTVNCNIGYITNKDENNSVRHIYTGDCGLFVDGFDSHIYTGAETNATRIGEIGINATLNVPCSEYALFDDTGAAPLWWREARGFRFHAQNPVDAGKPTLLLQNLKLDHLGTMKEGVWAYHTHEELLLTYPWYFDGYATDGKLEGYANVWLKNCVLSSENNDLHDFKLYDFSMLRLENSNTADANAETRNTITLHNRSQAYLSGVQYDDVTALGTNALTLDDTTLYGNILAAGTSDDVYELNRDVDTGVLYHSMPVAKYSTSVSYGFTGAKLTLDLEGASGSMLFRGNTKVPGIMVDHAAAMAIKGAGSLQIADRRWNGSEYVPAAVGYGYSWNCAAIGGTPAYEPLPHGLISVEGGTITADVALGSAAIGGSVTGPEFYYVLDDQGNYVLDGQGNKIIDEGQSTPGFSPDGGYFSIRGGVLNLSATEGGAAIGGARGGNGGLIEITGGTVNAASHQGGGGFHGGAAIGGGETVHEHSYELIGFQQYRFYGGPDQTYGIRPDVYVYTDDNGNLRYRLENKNNFFSSNTSRDIHLNSGVYTIEADAVFGTYTFGGTPGSDPDLFYIEPDTSTSIYRDKYTWAAGGGSGQLIIRGSGVVNASADTPGYTTTNDYNPKPVDYTVSDNYYLFYNGSYHRIYITELYDSEGNPTGIAQNHYNRFNSNTQQYEIVPFTVAGYGNPVYANGMTPGYVIGCASEEPTFSRRNTTEIRSGKGVRLLIMATQTALGVDNQDEPAAREDRWFYPDTFKKGYGEQRLDDSWWDYYQAHRDEFPLGFDATEYKYWPSIVDDNLLLFTKGWVKSTVVWGNSQVGDPEYPYDKIISGEAGHYEMTSTLTEGSSYRVQGNFTWPVELTVNGNYNMPAGATLTFLTGSKLTVPEGITILADPEQLVFEDGAYATGKGYWPGKPPAPDSPPSATQIQSILSRIDKTLNEELDADGNTVCDENGEPVNPVVVSHLGIATSGNDYLVIPGYSPADVRNKAVQASLEEKNIRFIISAGASGFRKKTVKNGEDVTVTWSLNSWHDAVVSLLENGALTATPGSYTLTHHFDVVVQSDGQGKLNFIELHSAKLNSPSYTVYEGQADDTLHLTYKGVDNKLVFTIKLDHDQVVNNKQVFYIPKFSGSQFSLDSVSPLKDKCALRYGGSFSFTTPFADFGGINVKELQLNYGGDSPTLGGINVDAHAEIPSIAGFPVKGKGKLKINTFSGKQIYSLNVSMETPIFEGAFEATFKEARGVVLPDTLYAELAVGEGGIPLVPPTVVGYIQGGGLGVSGLADTVAMDSFGAPPVRLKMAAKGKIIDVIEGWIRLSVGLDGFDLSMDDIKIADAKFIKACGISAKWDAGKKYLKNAEYWGFSLDMNQYIVVSIQLPGYEDEYGWDENDFPSLAFISARGDIGFGGFVGYNITEKNGHKTANFIYQVYASGSLNGSVNIPKCLVGGFFPLKNVTLGNLQMGFYAAANTMTSVNGDDLTGSPRSVLSQLAKNAKIDFDAAIGVKVVIGTGKFKGHVRIVYVLGDKSPSISGGWGGGKDLNLQAALHSAEDDDRDYVVLTDVTLEDTGETVPAIVEGGMKTVGSLSADGTAMMDEAGMELMGIGIENASNSRLEVTFDQEAVTNGDYLVIGLKDGNTLLNSSQVSVNYEGEGSFTLIPANYGDPAETTTSDHGTQEWYDADAFAVATDNSNIAFVEGSICFAPTVTGTYTITIVGSSAEIDTDNVIVVQNQDFASLEESEMALNDPAAANPAVPGLVAAAYGVTNANASRRYKIQLVLGAEEGVGDYLAAETGELTGSTAYSENIHSASALSFNPIGDKIPTGDYYPTVLLLEYVQASNASNTVETWAVVDQYSFDQTIRYTNNAVPAAPQNITLAYSGNGTMTVGWNAATDAGQAADVYQLTVYEEVTDSSGPRWEDTGLVFQTQDDSLIMDLNTLYGETATPDKNLRVGVKAQFQNGDGTYKTSLEGLSGAAALTEPHPPTVTYLDNVVLGEGSVHTLTVGAGGGIFRVKGEGTENLNVTVTDAATGNALSLSGNGTNTVTVNVPAGSNSLTLQVQAKKTGGQDYALNTIVVAYDTVPPPLMLNDLGSFPVWFAEYGSRSTITGHTEAGALIRVWEYGNTLQLVAQGTAGEDGSFAIPLYFTGEPTYLVEAVDTLGNRSNALTVTFAEADVTVTLDLNTPGASCSVSRVGLPADVPIGELPVPFCEGALFRGWYYQVESVEYDETEANWTTVTVEDKDGISVTQTVKPIKKVTMVNVPVTPGTAFSEDTTIYADWAERMLITFEPGFSASCSVNMLDVSKGEKVGELPVPVWTGTPDRMFMGWNTDPDGYGLQITETYVCGADTTVYALWSPYVTVTLNPGLGSCDVEAIRVVPGGSISAYPSGDEVASTGYTLNGWYTVPEPQDETTRVTGGETYNEDTTLYAVWTRNTDTLAVTLANWKEGDISLPELIYTEPEDTVGTPTVTYRGTGDTEYESSVRPTEAGTYQVTVQCDTFETAYVGSTEFTIAPNAVKFASHAMVLSGEIGVKFKVVYPKGQDMSGVYVDFAISDGRKSRMTFAQAEKSGDEACYFICYINALELGDTITATLHNGGTESTDIYSGMNYIQAARTAYAGREKLLALLDSLQDYGHYLQGSGWTDSRSHTAVPAVEILDGDDIAEAKAGVSGLGLTKDLGDGIADAKFSLTLNAETKINVSVKPNAGFTIVSEGYTERTIGTDTYYQFTSGKIGAGGLGTPITFTVLTSGPNETQSAATVTASPMSYVKAILNSQDFSDGKKYAMTAYYRYYMAAVDYQNNQQGG